MNNQINASGLCQRLMGTQVPINTNGHAGRFLENLIESWGFPVNRGRGCDIQVLGLELKSRDLDATSPQNVSTMTPDEIVATAYDDSVVAEKLQQQLRMFTRDRKIVRAEVYDFSDEAIQSLLREAYENGRKTISDLWYQCHPHPVPSWPSYIYGSEYGYWERLGTSNSYTFRLHSGAYEKIERMSKSTHNRIFEYS